MRAGTFALVLALVAVGAASPVSGQSKKNPRQIKPVPRPSAKPSAPSSSISFSVTRATCSGKNISLAGPITSARPLKRVEVYVGTTLLDSAPLTGTTVDLSSAKFTKGKCPRVGTTIEVRVYDDVSSQSKTRGVS